MSVFGSCIIIIMLFFGLRKKNNSVLTMKLKWSMPTHSASRKKSRRSRLGNKKVKREQDQDG